MDTKEALESFKEGKITIYDLVFLFDKGEGVENKEKGVIYTPRYIADYIVRLANPDIEDIVLEPSVGHGVFVFSLIEFMEEKYKLDKDELKIWFEKKVKAIELDPNSVEELKTILSIYFEKKGISELNFDNIKNDDALFCDVGEYNVVIGNPPYIRTKNLDETYLKKIRTEFSSCKSGNVDIYYAFMEKFSLKAKRFSFIVPNSYITNNSAKTLRNIIYKKIENVIDFKERLIFENARTYTSIFLMTNQSSDVVKYSNDIDGASELKLKSELNNDKWKFQENQGKSLLDKSDFNKINIVSSIATLRDKIYLIKAPILKNGCYTKEYEGVSYLIEKDICVDLFKLTKLNERYVIIFPYKNKKIINEVDFQKNYPNAYKYLLSVKSELNKRDKGKTEKYESWYAYGRKQGLNIDFNQPHMFIPLMTNKTLNVEIKEAKSQFLITSGYCLSSSDIALLQKIKDSLNSKDFLVFLEKEGKPWPGKITYYSLTTKQLKEFIFYEG